MEPLRDPNPSDILEVTFAILVGTELVVLQAPCWVLCPCQKSEQFRALAATVRLVASCPFSRNSMAKLGWGGRAGVGVKDQPLCASSGLWQ